MKTSFPRIRPCAQYYRLTGKGIIQAVNKTQGSVPSRRISQVIALAEEVHDNIRPGSDAPMHVYTEGRCHTAALMLGDRVKGRIDGLEGTDVIRATEVPGSRGEFRELRGLHHLSALYFPDMYILVDTTVAQLQAPNQGFKNTKTLVIVTEPDFRKAADQLEKTYKGGDWKVLLTGF